MEINYVIQKSRRRSMCLHIGNDKQVIVKVPIGTPDAMAISFMKEKKTGF